MARCDSIGLIQSTLLLPYSKVFWQGLGDDIEGHGLFLSQPNGTEMLARYLLVRNARWHAWRPRRLDQPPPPSQRAVTQKGERCVERRFGRMSNRRLCAPLHAKRIEVRINDEYFAIQLTRSDREQDEWRRLIVVGECWAKVRGQIRGC